MKIIIDISEEHSREKIASWVHLDDCANEGYYCSACNKYLVKEGFSRTVKRIKFCPNCGAKMSNPVKYL